MRRTNSPRFGRGDFAPLGERLRRRVDRAFDIGGRGGVDVRERPAVDRRADGETLAAAARDSPPMMTADGLSVMPNSLKARSDMVLALLSKRF
jgi:hypothetical protein